MDLRKTAITLFMASAAACIPAFGVNRGDGVVYKDKNVRFTVVADGIVRMEYAPDGKFIDDRSFIGYNRTYPEVKTDVTETKGEVVIKTPKMVVEYKKGKKPFSTSNLTITSAPGVKHFRWVPGQAQEYNLMGTTRTLDRWDGPDYLKKDKDGNWTSTPQKLETGLLARDGWTLIDDSKGYLLDNDPEIPWVKARRQKKGAQDWYFLAYGNDYKGALKDFTILSGKIPMPPRYAFGYWWSRWWAYSEHELRRLVDNFEAYDIPLEVLVIDMDWHYTDEAHGGWTGWTWNRRLFPEPEKFLNYLRDKNLKVTLNLHPASGVRRFEASYPEIARENGVNPESGKDIPWVSSDRRFVTSVFDHILDPMSKEGVSFWWLDWQQDLYDSKMDSLSNTWWLNHTFFNKMKSKKEGRPLIFHRWGGLGNHRYQIGFSGDSYSTWKTLGYMPYFTSTAANVGYGYWCHDLGGFYMAPGDTAIDPELYTRSFQFGVYSPMMRNHSTKNAKLNKEPWNFDRKTMSYIRDAIQRRYKIAPYIYAMAREAYDTGVSLCRPMYYEWPDKEEAYKYGSQYMFGDNMLMAPVTSPAVDGYSTVEVWLPDGEWYEEATGTLLKGGKVYERRFAMDEYPVYVKAGSILPSHTGKVSNLRSNALPYTLTVYPGGNGEFSVYEDFGDDDNYGEEFARTKVSSERDGNVLRVRLSPREGHYREMPDRRDIEVKAIASLRPRKVTVDGVETGFTYNPADLSATVSIPGADPGKGHEVVMTFPDNAVVADGTIGDMKRFLDAFAGIKENYSGLEVNEEFGPMSVVYEALGYAPEKEVEILGDFRDRFSRLEEVVGNQKMNDKARVQFLKDAGVKPGDKNGKPYACGESVAKTGSDGGKINLATYNIRYYAGSDSLQGDRWQTRSKVIADMVRFHEFDIFGTQEGLKFQLEDLRKRLPGYDYIGAGRDDGKSGGEHAAIFYRSDKFELMDHGDFWLSETPGKPGKGWDAVCCRICTWGKFRHRATGKEFIHFNLHMDHVGKKARVESVRLVMRKADDLAKGETAFITGDFNVDQTSDCYRFLSSSKKFTDVRDIADVVYETNGTWNEFNGSGYCNSRIDHIFVSPGVRVTRYGILTDSYRTSPAGTVAGASDGGYDCVVLDYDNRLPSDHFPVLTTVVLP